MKIMIVSRGYPTYKYKMNGIFEFDQAKALAAEGHEVIFAVVDVRSIRRWRKWGRTSFIKDGVEVETINFPIGNVPASVFYWASAIIFKILYKDILEKYGEPDIIHSHFLRMGYITVKALRETNIPIVLTEHLSTLNQRNIPIELQKIGNNTYSKVDKLITVSKPLSLSIEDKFYIGSEVVHNIIDISTFKYRKLEKEPEFTFVSTGSLIKRKNMDLLIEAVSVVQQSYPNIKLYIYGEGPEQKKLETLITTRNLNKNVFLEGLADRSVVATKMSKSHAFVLASKQETFGVAYAEALAMGLPVIATACGGPEEFVNSKNGILISVDDLNGLIEAILKMIRDYERYDKNQISKEITKKFGPKYIANKLLRIYLKLL